jgi:chemotaxis protein CheX
MTMFKALFITDSAVYGSTLKNMLKQHIEVSTRNFNSAREFEQYDLIIVDHKDNHDESHSEVSRVYAGCGFNDIPIIVASTRAQSEDVRRMKKAGASGILFKPFDLKTVYPYLINALKPVGIRTQIDVNLLNSFIEGTINVIETTTKSDVTRTDLFLKKNYNMFGEVTGLMAIGGQLNGTVAISFPPDLAGELVARMAACEASDQTTEEIHEGVREIINMISGNAKRLLSETGYSFNIAQPDLIIGHGHPIPHEKGAPFYIALFETLGKPFAIQLCVVLIGNNSCSETEIKQENTLVE